ncbi:MAG: radical SAM protein [Lentisphaerae bacterium]|nr:MAG: radical SAM protein [Lentisphaerota bacterium]
MTSSPSKPSVLLIHPLGYQPSAAGNDIARIANLMPPFGICSIAAWLEDHHIHTDIIDCFAHPSPHQSIFQAVARNHYTHVGVTCTTHAFPDASRILARIHAEFPHIVTVVGGPHISALGKTILEENPHIRVAVIGEGENPMLQLCQTPPEQYHTIPGIIFRDDQNNIITTAPQTPIKDLDSIPFPAYDKLHGFPRLYQLPIFNYPRAPSTSCSTSRGCPYQCSYCDRSVFRRSYRTHSAEYVYKLLVHLKSQWNIRHVNFYDDQFSIDKKRVHTLCDMLIEKPLGMTFNCAIRAEHVDPELLKKMKRAGCWMISLGIETGDPDLLAQHRQNPDLNLIRKTVQDIHDAGIRVKGLFMMGLPGETHQSIQRTKEFIRSLPIDDFNLSKFTPFPGSPIYQNIHKFGTFNEDYSLMDCMHFVFVPHGFTREELEAEFINFYRQHFIRPRTLLNYTAMLWKSPHSWYRFITNLHHFLGFAFSDKRIASTQATPPESIQ